MEITTKIKTKFLVFPINSYGPRKELNFFIDGVQVFDLSLSLDSEEPTFLANVNVERFMGKTLTIKSIPESNITFTPSDKELFLDDDSKKRPMIHFTAKSGWTNDPNGLYKYGGEYHMFFQHNPCDITWANMHWGHAVSRDLVSWRELDEFLYPDENGLAYSGCAFIDKKNASGLKSGDDDPILIYYTAAPKSAVRSSISYGKKWTQRILASKDGGKSFAELDEYVDEICPENRDPKVEYSPELDKYVMALYLKGHDYAILTSDDLLNWCELQRITLSDDDECPNLARYKVKNTDEYKWVLYGAHSRYSVYEIKDGKFTEIQPSFAPNILTDAYAGQDFQDEENERRIKIDWIKTKKLIPPANFSQIFGIPVELELIKDGDRYFLIEMPAREIIALRKEKRTVCPAITGTSVKCEKEKALFIKIKATYEKGLLAELYAMGRKITIDTDKNLVSLRTSCARLSESKGEIDITVIADKYTLEVFSDGGRFYTTAVEPCDTELTDVLLLGDTLPSCELSVNTLN